MTVVEYSAADVFIDDVWIRQPLASLKAGDRFRLYDEQMKRVHGELVALTDAAPDPTRQARVVLTVKAAA